MLASGAINSTKTADRTLALTRTEPADAALPNASRTICTSSGAYELVPAATMQGYSSLTRSEVEIASPPREELEEAEGVPAGWFRMPVLSNLRKHDCGLQQGDHRRCASSAIAVEAGHLARLGTGSIG